LNPDADKRAAGLASQARAREKRGMLLDRRGCVVPANPEAVEWLEMGAFDQLKKRNQKTYQQLIYEMLKLKHHQQEIVLSLRKSEHEWARGFLSDQGWREHEKIVGINVVAATVGKRSAGNRSTLKRWRAR
jgi:heptosyltransferase-2